jgi:5-oxoprolinase (ATP-hydrolysing) subunit A
MLPDLNCDMGEGIGNDEAIMPFITSANISCGFHAGNTDTMRKTIDLALKYEVKVGAHPSFRDKENFGRVDVHMSDDKLYALVLEQLIKIDLVAKERGASLHHVKPHGALYNMAARDRRVARIGATAIKDFDESLVLYGLSGSYMISEANAIGLVAANEVFADRTYNNDGSLTPRNQPGALIEDVEKCLAQVTQMINDKTVVTTSGQIIAVAADTICIHSDGKYAVQFAKAISQVVVD